MLLPVKPSDGLKVEVTQCSYLNSGAGCAIMKITDFSSGYTESDFMNVKRSLYGECSIMKVRKDHYLATVLNNNCKLATILAESGCFLTSAVARNDHEIEWTVFAANSTYISNFIARLQTEGYGVERLSFELMDADILLTPRQEEIIEYAYRNGYYESPKDINIEDLCERFDCSKSTMSVILKSAEKKLIGAYLNMDNQDKIH